MVETKQKPHDDADSDSEEEVEEQFQKVDIDASKLTPLSPEVISKQVRCIALVLGMFFVSDHVLGNN